MNLPFSVLAMLASFGWIGLIAGGLLMFAALIMTMAQTGGAMECLAFGLSSLAGGIVFFAIGEALETLYQIETHLRKK